MENYALCNKCREPVPAEHDQRENRIFLIKKCASCGENEVLISNDAEAYSRKRAFLGNLEYPACKLNCTACDHVAPNFAFIELTNRCNMNCPICITNVPSMGFEFEPNLDYFRVIFENLAKLKPKPSLQLFGGEPTVREDLFDIIRMARSYDFSVRVVTNGLKLADPEYCERLLAENVSVLISFDGFDKRLYEKFRGSAGFLDKKVRALENLSKGKRFDYAPERTTPEDVEHLLDDAVGGGTEFVPLGSLETDLLSRVLKIKSLPFMGVHPNCESLAILVSDGERHLPVDAFLKHGFAAAVADLRKLALALEGTREGFSQKRKAWFGLARIVRRHFNFGAAVGRRGLGTFFTWAGIFARVALGKKFKDVLRERTRMQGLLQIIILPFEDYDTSEGTRLKMCKSSFVYPAGKDGPLRYIPVCAWERHKVDIMRRVALIFNKPGFDKGLSDNKKEDRVAESV
jgi:organic radical activating enzyme